MGNSRIIPEFFTVFTVFLRCVLYDYPESRIACKAKAGCPPCSSVCLKIPYIRALLEVLHDKRFREE